MQCAPPSKASYASVLSSNAAPLSRPITISTQTSSFIQAQREIIVKITDTSTIESLRAKNPRNLQNHVDRAIEQSRNKHIERIRVASANQLKSGDLSIKTSNRNDAEALKQFANDWINRIGRGTSIRLPTYGILAYGIRTSSMHEEDTNGEITPYPDPLGHWRKQIDEYRCQGKNDLGGPQVYLCPLHLHANHFTLLEINEQTKMIYHYDSLANQRIISRKTKITPVRRVVEVSKLGQRNYTQN